MFSATTLILSTVFAITVYYYLKFYNSIKKNRVRNLRGLEPQWLIGNLKNAGLTSGKTALHEVFAEFKEKYGDAFSFWLGPYHSIVLSRLEYVQHVFTNRHIYDMSTQTTSAFSVLFPAGLISLRGDAWKRHARFMLPMLKRAKILPYLDTIVTCIDRLIDEQFVKQDGKIHTDLIHLGQNALLNIIAFIAFDFDLEGSTDLDSSNLRKAFHDFVRCANDFIVYFTGLPIWMAKIVLLFNRKFQRAL
jgi:cytochrome P450